MAAALVPPHAATASPDRATARSRASATAPRRPAPGTLPCPPRPRKAGPASGSSTHGSMAAGRNSADSTPARLSAIGEAA